MGNPVQIGLDGKIPKVNIQNTNLNNRAGALALKRPASTPVDGLTEKKLPTRLSVLQPRQSIDVASGIITAPIKEMLAFLSAQIRDKEKELECPVCLEMCTSAPIFACEEFHLLCASCRPKVLLFPQCRREFKKPGKRHRFAEKIGENVNELKHQRNKLLEELTQIKMRQLHQDKINGQVSWASFVGGLSNSLMEGGVSGGISIKGESSGQSFGNKHNPEYS